MNAFKIYDYRRMLGIPWTAKRTKASIIQQLVLQERLVTTIQDIIRQENIETITIQRKIEGRGRSPTRYTDQIRKATGRIFAECVRFARDREEWYEMVDSVGHDVRNRVNEKEEEELVSSLSLIFNTKRKSKDH